MSSAKNEGESQGAWKERDRGDSAETTRLWAAERNSPRLLMSGEIWATGRQSVWARGEDTNLWLPPSCAMSRISTGPVSPLTPFSSVMFPLTAPHVGPRPLSVQEQGSEKSIGPVSPCATVITPTPLTSAVQSWSQAGVNQAPMLLKSISHPAGVNWHCTMELQWSDTGLRQLAILPL